MMLREKLSLVDGWADFYLRAMGLAEHMKIVDNGRYETMGPIGNTDSPSSVYNMRLDNLSDQELHNTIQEIRDLNKHTWWPLAASDRVLQAIHGKIPVYTVDDGEIYSILMPEDLPCYSVATRDVEIRHVNAPDDFELWCGFINSSYGTIAFDYKNHFHLVEEGKLNCFLGFVDGKAVGISAILNNDGAAALEFVVVLPVYCKKGIATVLCQSAISYACMIGVKHIVGRGGQDGSRRLIEKLGFSIVTTE